MFKIIKAIAKYVSKSKKLSKARGARAARGKGGIKKFLSGGAKLGLAGAGAGALGMLGKALLGGGNDAKEESYPSLNQYEKIIAGSQTNGGNASRHTDVPAIIDQMKPILVPDIKPELGPNEGQYAPHLNLIIERIARLESRVNTQSALLDSLRSVIDSAIDQNEALDRKDERRRDENDIEKKKSMPKVGRGVAMAAGAGVGLLGLIEKYVGPPIGLAAGAAALALENWETDPSEEEPLGIMDMLDEAESTIAGATVGLQKMGVFKAGEQLGRDAKARQLKAERAARPINQKQTPKVKGQVGVTADGKPVVKSKAGNLTVAGADGKATTQTLRPDQVKATSATGAKPPTGTGGAATKMGAGSKEGSKVINALRKMIGLVEKARDGSKKIIEAAKTYLMKFGSMGVKIMEKIGKAVIKWILIIEAFMAMIRSAELFMFGSITKDQWHTGNKDQINKIIKMFGPAWLFTTLGMLSPIPGGSMMGLIAGIIWGDALYDAVGFDKIVGALYDTIVLQKWSAIPDLFKQLYDWVMNELPKILFEKAKETVEYAQGIDKIATEEEIKEDYGDASLTEIAIESKGGMLSGDDENALLYVADNIDSIEQLKKVDEEMLEKKGMTLNDYARSFLSDEEYEQFVNTLNASIDAGPSEENKISGTSNDSINVVDDPDKAQEGDYLSEEAMREVGFTEEEIATAMKNREELPTVTKEDIKDSAEENEKVKQLVETTDRVSNIIEQVENNVKIESGGLALAASAAAENALTAVKIESVLSAGNVKQVELHVPTQIVKEVKGKDSTILPVILQGPGKNIKRAAATSPASTVEGSIPSYRTRDNFLTVSNYT